MDILEAIKHAYDYENLQWIEKNYRFSCDRGNKFIRIWQDKELLDWHIVWRDRVGKYQDFFLDRMIRTKDNLAFLEFESNYITIHDDEIEDYRQFFDALVVGNFIGEHLKSGEILRGEYEQLIKENIFPENQLINKLDDYRISTHDKKLLNKVINEAIKRLNLAKALVDKANGELPPVIDPVESIEQCRSVYHCFYWKGGCQSPQFAYTSLRNFLLEWQTSYDTASLRQLLDSIHNKFPLDKNQGFLLLAELVTPWEVIDLLKRLKDSDEKVSKQIFHQFKNSWENHRKLVTIVADWIDLSRKKVVQ